MTENNGKSAKKIIKMQVFFIAPHFYMDGKPAGRGFQRLCRTYRMWKDGIFPEAAGSGTDRSGFITVL